VRDVIESFPIGGEGVLCGPRLKETVKDYKLADEALEVTEHKVYRKSGGSFNKGLKMKQGFVSPDAPSIRSLSGTSSFLRGGWASNWVLEIIRCGYALEFSEMPQFNGI
jgi:hypothetical protein